MELHAILTKGLVTSAATDYVVLHERNGMVDVYLKDKKTDAPIYRPMIGRINERRSTVRGRNNPWSIAEKTPEDLATIQKYADKIRAITAEVKATREGGSTSDTNDFE